MFATNSKGDKFGVSKLTYAYYKVILESNGLKVRLV
jgi:hypothetical protein